MLTMVFPFLLASAGAVPTKATVPTAAVTYGAPDCRINALLPSPADKNVRWSGACKDGFADGPGTLAWNDDDASERRIDGTLVRGAASGEAKLTWAADKRTRGTDQDRDSYEGTLRTGQPDGQGFFQFADGAMYEGGVVNGKPQGAGIRVEADRSRYDGQWVDGKRDGKGSAVFAMGGSYKGDWRNDSYHGLGTIVYAGAPRTWQGRFKDNRPDGVATPEIAGESVYHVMREGGVPTRAAVTFLPPEASWAQLNVAEQNYFKVLYPALAPGDEPPYPVTGTLATNQLIGKIVDKLGGYHGLVRMHVLVGVDGKAKSVTAIGKLPEAVVRYVGAAVMRAPYKPAMCQGMPCEMVYPVSFRLN